ncbi:MAG: PhoU domain-containing protein [Nitriliruptoraceae bacterium]
MAFSFFRRGTDTDDRLDRIEATIQQMLADDRRAFELAMAALLGEVPVDSVRTDVKQTDRRVNEGERTIRRELVIHASVAGALDTPALLVYMSVVKDIERIGDYAKNLLDIARDHVTLEGHENWPARRDAILRLMDATAETFEQRNVERARELLDEQDALLDRFDDEVSALVRGEDTGGEKIARALALRYLKRIVAHMTNILSSVVMPLDRLDYFDEDPEDREIERDGGRPPEPPPGS